MLTQNLGYPRIGAFRELKKASELYWSGKESLQHLLTTGKKIREANWTLQKNAHIDLIPSNDFSFYDQVLDMSFTVNAIPERYHEIAEDRNNTETDLYFAMARGYQKDGKDIIAMEMTKWFDTNYHYIVPEFHKNQKFSLFSNKITNEYQEAKVLGIETKPVIIGPVSYLLLGKEKEDGFHRIELIKNLLPVYIEIIEKLEKMGAQWIQLDEPFLTLDLSDEEKKAYHLVYDQLRKKFPYLKIMVATYFDCTGDNLGLAVVLPIDALHIDLVRCPSQLNDILQTSFILSNTILSLGVIDGRNIWINDFEKSLSFIQKAIDVLGEDRVMIAPSCSLLHSPCDLDNEKDESVLTAEIKQWMAFAKQKIEEVANLKKLASIKDPQKLAIALKPNKDIIESRKNSPLIHKPQVKERVRNISDVHSRRASAFKIRQKKQEEALNLPLFPTTTIGSFPQTDEIRQLRAKLKNGTLSQDEYEQKVKSEIDRSILWQEEIGIDVLVHGEFERNDMVEYFGEQLDGYVFSQNGWVQSYGSRCVKPPIIYGDIERSKPMTVKWSQYAQSRTNHYMKGMLTGPVTILQWSFVRDDQSRSETTMQIALAIRDEVTDLEKAGIKIIQIDEPAIREGLPLHKADWDYYLNWAVKAFRISASGVKDETQIHTHMCYSEFNDIISHIANMDADVITIETSRSQMELLDAFADFNYPNEIGPGVYDIHSPRVPSVSEIENLLEKALAVIPARNLWVNPDCGLKTRKWAETELALKNMMIATKKLRQRIKETSGIEA
ncbi:5-methyltetrahydropteroyltriglutamate--homocysteine S-methyltransferase [Sporocytophaga myxococcoides]|uniref:5-methyltetrahydropteroyltriglutamate--homocysteine methyltransferase n=1 Tax=Sporocytophaga myxococcoides TaxID=153721 RepID=A0A098LGM7_9BACT|nr:5-methyltetrahydropteroyltriglutamate--homocysteine S-methyltransferase [Sporocytophaga myxococcoides]GAL85597.1 5-methyltetrahydropteroyltriglutamate--homocysteine S-methyltransferase [Sporocytophaga myxococcoides]